MWAVMVCLDGKEDWIYITEDTKHCWDLKPVLFDTEDDAEAFASSWKLAGAEKNVKVVSYDG